jgi:Na+/melibiose symporter-like transporter
MSLVRLSRSVLLAYAGVNIPMAILHQPALTLLPALYAKYAGIDVATLGLILIVARIFDAVLDPAIGYASDHTRLRLGRRKSWIVLGAIIAAVAAYFLFRPGPTTGPLYFLLASLLLYLGWTFVEIPHGAWINEISADYDERTRLATWRYVAGLVGTLFFLATPFLPLFPTTEMTPDVTSFASWFVIALLLPTTLAAIWLVPDRAAAAAERSFGFGQTLRALLRNRPFLRFALIVALTNFSSGMVAGLYYFFIDAHLGIAARYAHIALVVTGISIAATAFWIRVIARLGKHRVVAVCAASTALTLAAMGFIPRGTYAFPAMTAIFGLSAFLAAGSMSAYAALLADVVDYGTFRTGRSDAGNYFAAFAFLQKCALAVGGGASLLVAGLFGFDPKAANGSVAMTGFFLAFLVIPCLLNAAAALAAWNFPIDRTRHAVISRWIARDRRLLPSTHA